MHEIIRSYPPSDLPMTIQLAGVSYCDGSYHVLRRQSDITVIEYIFAGEGFVVIDGVAHPVGRDHIYLLPKGQTHRYYSSAESPWKKVFLNVTGELAVELADRYGLGGQWLFDGTGLSDIFCRIAALVCRSEPTAATETALTALYFEAVERLARSVNRAGHPPEAVALRDYLDRHPDRVIGNRELAGCIFRSPDYCVKLFRREYGTTPYDYQLDSKLRIARRLLRNTSLPVAEIAARVGYPDASYFSGLFRRRVGVCPRIYRQKK